MEIDGFYMEQYLNLSGVLEMMDNTFIKSRLDKVLDIEIESEEDYYNMLISLTEYSFFAFNKDAEHTESLNRKIDVAKSDKSFNNLFHYDYSNRIDYDFIYKHLKNPMIRKPIYAHYCNAHKNKQVSTCLDCLERYRVITRNLIPLIKTLRKDLCSIYFIDVLYDLIRFENRGVYAFITYMVNEYSDGSSYKAFITKFGKKNVKKLLKQLNKPFRRIDFKMVLKKYVPLLYGAFVYSINARTDCLDRVYDYMLHEGLSMFKSVPSTRVVVGYKVGDQYRIDILETPNILNHVGNRDFRIATNPLLEGLNFGFYDHRLHAYNTTNRLDNDIKQSVRKLYEGFRFSGKSVFTGATIHSENIIVIGFLKESVNTFQNFRLDIHIESAIPNNATVDRLRFIDHDKWAFEDNEHDVCYT